MALPMRDVVVLLPGIGGTKLMHDGKDIWAMSAGAVGRAIATLGGSVKDLALTADNDIDEQLADGVTAPSLLPDQTIVPGLKWRIDGYGVVDATLRRGFELDTGHNFFHFPYDWRRDNRAHARRLQRSSKRWLEDWRRESGAQDAKLVLIAHSMGGLVARYFLECLEGWRSTRTLITFGTPYSGSLNALGFLVNGYEKKLGPVTLLDLTKTMRTWTSVYQLLPIFQCVDLGDGTLRRLGDLNTLRTNAADQRLVTLNASSKQRALALLERLPQRHLENALTFHSEIATSVEQHLAEKYEGTGGYDIRPVIGEFQPTLQSGRMTFASTLDMLEERSGEDEGGDGTVPRLSSVPAETFHTMRNVAFAAQRHSSLQNSDPVLTQVHGLLRGGAPDPSLFFAGLARVGLDVDELFDAEEPVRFRTNCDTPETRLTADVVNVVSNVTVSSSDLDLVGPDWMEFTLPTLLAGDYRLVVRGGAEVDRVSEIFSVVGQDLDPKP